MVRIDATTSDLAYAGTDSDGVDFVGYWNANGNKTYQETFRLNNPDVDDLDRNTVSTFYYLLTTSSYVSGLTQDQFKEGKIKNSATDGWHCYSILLTDRSPSGSQRS